MLLKDCYTNLAVYNVYVKIGLTNININENIGFQRVYLKITERVCANTPVKVKIYGSLLFSRSLVSIKQVVLYI